MTDFERYSTDGALLLALVKGATVRSAAEQAGLSEATAFRRLVAEAVRWLLAATRTEADS